MKGGWLVRKVKGSETPEQNQNCLSEGPCPPLYTLTLFNIQSQSERRWANLNSYPLVPITIKIGINVVNLIKGIK